MTDDIATILSQFGPAGLMGLLWILERRHAATRERQLGEAHRHLAADQQELAALLHLVRDNTRAIVTLEQTQQRLLRVAEHVNERLARTASTRQPQALHEVAAANRAADAA
jgi:hypothetical protein